MKIVDFAELNGHFIARWVGTEMALSEGDLGSGPVLWENSSVPYLQLISVDVQLSDGSIYRMHSNADDGSGYYGLYLVSRDVIDKTSLPEIGSIYRTRDLSEFPIGAAAVAINEIDGPNAVLRVEMVVGGHTVSFWSAEVYERDAGHFELVGKDESILIQVDGARPRSATTYSFD